MSPDAEQSGIYNAILLSPERYIELPLTPPKEIHSWQGEKTYANDSYGSILFCISLTQQYCSRHD